MPGIPGSRVPASPTATITSETARISFIWRRARVAPAHEVHYGPAAQPSTQSRQNKAGSGAFRVSRLDRKIFVVPPLFPGAIVDLNIAVAGEHQSQRAVRGSDRSLTIGD